jgi:hypothetical protein
VVRRPAVLADGTYATQTAVEAAPLASSGTSPNTPNLRTLLLVSDPHGWRRSQSRTANPDRQRFLGRAWRLVEGWKEKVVSCGDAVSCCLASDCLTH